MTIGSKQEKKDARRTQARSRQQRAKMTNTIFLVVFLGGFAYLAFANRQTSNIEATGTDVNMQPGEHLELGAQLEYNSNPPSSGPHFGNPMPAGFYDETDETVIGLPQPEGHIVHALEHGYVTIWYNCTELDTGECEELKDNIKSALKDNPTKVIAYPWPTGETPIALTSWGQILILDAYDADQVVAFILANRSHERAPEPNVP